MRINKSELSKKIGQLKGIVPSRPTIEALKGVLCSDGYLIASDTNLTVKAKLEGMEEETEPFIIPAKAFDFIGSLPDGELEVSVSKGNLVIKTGKIKNQFKTLGAELFAYTKSIDTDKEPAKIPALKLKKAIEENIGIDYGRAKTYTVGNWLEVWYENYAKIKMRPSTYLTYHGYIENHIKPQLGKIPLNDLTTLHLQQFYKKLLAEGRVERIESQKQPKGLSTKTVRNIHQIISSALKLAVEQRLIARNPADGCALPKAEHKEMQTLPVEQLTSFLREAKDSGVFALYYIDLTTGLRRGELLGLKWSDIDLEKGDLRVQRQIGRIDGKIIEMPLKTKNAYRTLPLSADAINVLMQQRRKTGNSEWVFPSPTGGPMSPDSVLHMLHRVLKRAGLPKVRFHDLRHTFATLALQNDVDIKTVSGMLGHFSAGFTLDTYAHVTTSAKREAAKTMGSILSGAV